MTDSSLASMDVRDRNALPVDDQLVYVPFDALPKDLLSKLEDFKVIVKDDKAGDRILPKERLGEVLRSLNRGDPLLPTGGQNAEDEQVGQPPNRSSSLSPDTTVIRTINPQSTLRRDSESPSTSTKRQFEHGETSMERDISSDYVNLRREPTNNTFNARRSAFQDPREFYRQNRLSDINKSPLSAMPYLENNKPALFNKTILDRQRRRGGTHHETIQADDFHEDEPSYGFGTNSRVSMDTAQEYQRLFETTPRKCPCPDSALADISLRQYSRRHEADSYMNKHAHRHGRNLPSPCELSRTIQTGDVSRARKQLFLSPSPSYDSFFDENEYQKENYFHPSRSPRDCHQLDYAIMEDIAESPRRGPFHNCSPLIPERGLKRKYFSEDDQAYLYPGPSRNTRMASQRVADRLLEELHPSKRPCYDIGPTEKMEDVPSKCACSMMESHFLQMTEGAYRNIRRKDSTSESFEQFRRELIQTNSVLKESVSILRAIQQICSHKGKITR